MIRRTTSSVVVVAVVIATFGPGYTNSQVTSDATCLPGFKWMENSAGQTPCLVAGYLSSQCNSGQWAVPAITPPSGFYLPPHDAGANICRCNTVLYSLLSACSTCQGGIFGNWTDWRGGCPAQNIFIQQYPLELPQPLKVPAWAYLNVVPGNNFSIALATSIVAAPEVSAVAGSSATGTTATGTQIPTGTGTQLPGNTALGSSGKKSSSVGAIVGGIIGGLVLIGAIIALIVFLRRKNSREQTPSIQYRNSRAYTPVSLGGPGQSNYATSTTPTANTRPYNPDDPSTYPVSPAPYAAPFGKSSTGYYPPFTLQPGNNLPGSYATTAYRDQQGYNKPFHPSGYSGAAELQ